jgi:hypothetical protein
MTSRNDRKQPITLDDLAGKTAQLCRQMENLDRSVRKLADRITPYDDEAARLHPQWQLPDNVVPARLENVMAVLRQIDKHLESLLRDFNAVRAKIVAADQDAYLLDDMSPWLKSERK